MSRLLHTATRCRRFLVVAAVAAVTVTAAQAVAAAGAPPQSAIDNASATWAAKGYVLDARGRPAFDELPPLAAIQAASAAWAAKARLLDAEGGPINGSAPIVAISSGSTFSWSDFGIGAAAMLGAVLLAGGLAVGAHVGRKGHAPAHPA